MLTQRFEKLADLIQEWSESSYKAVEDTQDGEEQPEAVRTYFDKRYVLGTSENDFLQGNDLNQVMIGFGGDDGIDGGAGDDLVLGWRGNDTLGGGPGSDRVFGGPGDDHFYYDADENEGDRDFYSGGSGEDTLKLNVSEEIYNSDTFQQDLGAYGERTSSWQSNRPFKFESIDLRMHRIENVEIYVDGELVEDATPAEESEPTELPSFMERFAARLPAEFLERFESFSGSSDNGTWLS